MHQQRFSSVIRHPWVVGRFSLLIYLYRFRDIFIRRQLTVKVVNQINRYLIVKFIELNAIEEKETSRMLNVVQTHFVTIVSSRRNPKPSKVSMNQKCHSVWNQKASIKFSNESKWSQLVSHSKISLSFSVHAESIMNTQHRTQISFFPISLH